MNTPPACWTAVEVSDVEDPEGRRYQKVTVREGDLAYVAIERKVYKYDHEMHFARFVMVPGDGCQDSREVAVLDASESLTVSYDTAETETDTCRRKLTDAELVMLMPPGCVEVRTTNLAPQAAARARDPKTVFDYGFDREASKLTRIVLSAVAPGAWTADWTPRCATHVIATLADPADPFGQCEFASVVK